MSRATNKAKREASMNLLPRGPAYKAVRERMPYGEEKESCGRGEQRGGGKLARGINAVRSAFPGGKK